MMMMITIHLNKIMIKRIKTDTEQIKNQKIEIKEFADLGNTIFRIFFQMKKEIANIPRNDDDGNK